MVVTLALTLALNLAKIKPHSNPEPLSRTHTLTLHPFLTLTPNFLAAKEKPPGGRVEGPTTGTAGGAAGPVIGAVTVNTCDEQRAPCQIGW